MVLPFRAAIGVDKKGGAIGRVKGPTIRVFVMAAPAMAVAAIRRSPAPKSIAAWPLRQDAAAQRARGARPTVTGPVASREDVVAGAIEAAWVVAVVPPGRPLVVLEEAPPAFRPTVVPPLTAMPPGEVETAARRDQATLGAPRGTPPRGPVSVVSAELPPADPAVPVAATR